ncbi:MAG: chromosome segregation protein SMC [Tissierellia bacterium]|nr:chromosome segregation protein SMC [Tissierellia bacterium]
MKLKSLELYGFKSFAERSKLVFEKDISAIVGPNGSGKSNISDAIRWVLGEQSAKSLRGTNMHDVIFSGTDTKKQMNMASVSLTLDNRDKTLDLEFDDINVTRKVYRTGESDYLLNNSSVRLKDIRELFLDTGIGKDGYSIIGQGRIDEILSSKSEDRRVIFEEASGIAKFKYKKIESERKLEKTQESLRSLKNELKIKEQELAILETQANNAKEGVKLTKQLEKMELSLLKFNLDKIQIDLSKLQADKIYLEDSLSQKTSECKLLSDRIAPINEEIVALNDSLEKIKEDSSKKDRSIAYFESEINLLDEKISFLKQDLSRLEKESIDREEKFKVNIKKIDKFSTTLAEEKSNREDLDKKLLRLQKDFSNKQVEKDRLYKVLNEESSEYNKLKDDLNKLTILRNTKEKLDENNLIKKQEYSLYLNKLAEELRNNQIQVEDKEKKLEEVQKLLEKNTDTINRLIDDRSNLQDQLNEKASDLQALKDDYVKNKSQRDILYSIYKSYEGYYRPIQNLLKARDRDKEVQKRIFGVLADLIEVDKKYRTAIDVTLAGSLQNIVVEDETDAKFLIDYIKQHGLGRITFLPISKISGSDYNFNHPLVIDSLNKLIKYNPKIKGIIDHFLSRTLLVKNMEDAIAVSKDVRNFRIVTLDGDIINSWGSMVGGKLNKRESNSLLNRQKTIEDLDVYLLDLKREAEQVNLAVKKDKDQLSYILSQLRELDLENSKYSSLKNSISSELKELRVKIDFKKESINEYNLQIESMDKELEENDPVPTGDLEEKISAYEEKLARLNDEFKLLNDYLIENDKNIIKKEAEFESLTKDIGILENSIEDLCAENDEIQRQTSIAKDNILKSKETISYSNKKIEEYRKKITEYKKILEKNALEIEQLKAQVAEKNEMVEKDNLQISKLKDELANIDKKAFQVDLKLESTSNKKDEYIESYCDSYDIEKHDLLSKLEDFEPIKVLKKDVLAVKNKLSKIGFFNFATIEQYRVEFEALEFMRGQFDDLMATREDILDMIKKLESDMVRLFKQSFKDINDNFTRVFSILFDGGEAGLLLDGDDVLTAGIEIVAKPPGKKLKNIGLLSGGEKALTAVALLFSIFEINPAPFCVLDEIDAALDEANIKRYLQYLRKLTDKTQFIIITHRKVTMEMAEILYGVTMEEKGISKIITLALDDYKEE